ncbi:MAG: CSLREA domain-containing protein [Bryobacteraceae bacterium]
MKFRLSGILALAIALMSFAAWRLATQSPQVHAQTQKLYLSTPRQFKASYRGSTRAMGAIAGRPSALAMASADLDGDAVNDLAIGFAAPGGGLIAIHRGNLDAFAPQSEASFNAIGRGDFPAPFLPEAELVEIPSRPDFLAAGDLIGQSGSALAAAARGGQSIHLLARGASGKMELLQTIATAGTITGLDAQQLTRGKYWQVAVGVRTESGSRLVIYSGSNEGLSQTASFALNGDATAFASGNLDGDDMPDLLVVAGGQLAILHAGSQRLEPVSVPFTVTAAALGRFQNDRDPMLQMALLAGDGRVHIMAHDGFDAIPLTTLELQAKRRTQIAQMRAHVRAPRSPERKVAWQEIENYPGLGAAGKLGHTPLMFRTRISSNGADDLAIIGASKLSVLAHLDEKPTAGVVMDRTDLAVDAATAMPLRVNIDGRPGIVFVPRGETAPQAMMPLPDPTFTVNTTTDTVDKNPGDGVCADVNNQCSLRAAIMEANALAGTDTIMIPAGTYTLTIGRNCPNNVCAYDARTGTLDVIDSVNITGAGQNTTIIQGGTSLATSVDKVFSFNQDITTFTNATVKVSNLTIQNGFNRGTEEILDGWGGAFDCDTGTNGTANVTLTNVTINNNKLTEGQGGGFAMFNTNGGTGSVTVTGSTISNNANPAKSNGEGGQGGGIFVAASGNANLTMSSTQVTGNTTTAAGGDDAIGGGLLVNGNATLHRVTITGNTAGGDGGGIYADSNSLTIDQTSIISNNTAGGNGGGLWFSSVSGEPASLSEVTMMGNSAASGGGVYINSGNSAAFTMRFGRLANNTPSNLTQPAPANGIAPGTVTATDNWWGTNSPATTISQGVTSTGVYTPYIVLGVSANPTTVETNQTSTLTADLSKDNSGTTVSDLAVFNGQPITFGNATGGTIITAQPVNLTSSAMATSTFKAGGSAASGGAAATFDNQTISVTLTIVGPPSMTESFTPSTVTPNTTSQVAFTITNSNSASIDANFSDSLPAGLVVASPNGVLSTCGGTISATAGTATIGFSNASLATGSCSIKVNVVSATDNSYTNSVTINSTAAGSGNPASATLTVANPPAISKAFGGSAIPLNGSTSLTFTLSNPNANVTLNGVAFTDTLPNILVVSTPNGLGGTCAGSSAAAGGGTVSLSSQSLAPGGSCTVLVSVTGTTAGSAVNTVQATSTNGGSSSTASATIAVVRPPANFTKSFGSPTIPLNGSTNLTFSLANNNSGNTLHGIGFSDTLPAGLTVSTPNGLSGSCGGGTIAATAGTGVVSLSGAALAPGTSCSFSVNVTGTAAGIQNNVTGNITSTEGGSGSTASASVTVMAAPSIAKSFNPTTIAVNDTSLLTFTVTNPAANAVSLTGVGFTDAIPAGLTVTSGTSGQCGGTLAVAGPTLIQLANALVPANGQCQFGVRVTGAASGSYTNTTGAVTSTNGGTGNTASASITVGAAPSISKSFTASSIPLNGTTTLTFSITNPNASLALSGVSFTDTFPNGLVVASNPNASNTCGGALSTGGGTGSVSLAGGSIAGGGSCAVSVTVQGTQVGSLTNSVQVTSANSGAGNRSNASLLVIAPPTFSKLFGAATIPTGGSTSLTFNLANINSGTTLHGIGFTDMLPAGLVISTPNGLNGSCGGGAIAATAGTGIVSLSGGALAPGTPCSFSVNVTGAAPGVQNNVTGNVTSTEGGSGSMASASVTVVAPPSLSKAFADSAMQVGGNTSLAFTITNPAANTVAETGVAFTDVLPPGLTVGNQSGFACGGTLTTSGGNRIALSGTTIAVNGNCQFNVFVTATAAGTFNNVTGNVSSTNGGLGNMASASITASQGAIGGSLGPKSGPLNARVWQILIGNNGPGMASGAAVTSLALQQTLGTACSPVIVSAMPVSAGNIAAKATAPANVVIDFSSCTGTVFFKATVGISADGGATTGSFVKLNQLP